MTKPTQQNRNNQQYKSDEAGNAKKVGRPQDTTRREPQPQDRDNESSQEYRTAQNQKNKVGGAERKDSFTTGQQVKVNAFKPGKGMPQGHDKGTKQSNQARPKSQNW